MESWLLSDKEKNIDSEWLTQNIEQFFETVAILLKTKDEKTISKVCSKLTNLYKDKDSRHQNFIINCIPVLLKYYFVYFYDEKICSIIEVCILTIYNLSLTDENVKLNKIRIPNLSTPSVYHSPLVTATQFELSESAMSKYESEYVIVQDHFKPYLETINTEIRFNIIRCLLLLYYSKLSTAIKSSKLYFCDMCLKVCKINRQSLTTQAIYLNSDILIEMLHSLFYLFNNNLQLDAYIAIEAITVKAEEELFSDVILICNSIKNIIQQSKTEPSLQNVMNSNENGANSHNHGSATRSGSISSNRKKSADASSPNVSHHNYKISSAADSPSSSPKSSLYILNPNEAKSSLNEIYISPSGEMRNAAKRASVKLQQQQLQQSAYIMQKQLQAPPYDEYILPQQDESSSPPPLPKTPPPPLNNELRENSLQQIYKNMSDNDIPIIDETPGDNGDDQGSYDSTLTEKF